MAAKPALKKTAPKTVVVRKAATKPAIASVSSRSPVAKPVSAGKKAVTRKLAPVDAPIKHISPEEAVAHIQALLEAKQDRVRQGPGWPDANPTQPMASGGEMHPPVSAEVGGMPSEGADSRVLAAQRGDQSKRKA
jgi:hypothetical protein